MCGEEGTWPIIKCNLSDRKYQDSCVDIAEHVESVAFICPRCEGSPLAHPQREPARGRLELIEELPEAPFVESAAEEPTLEGAKESPPGDPTEGVRDQDDGFAALSDMLSNPKSMQTRIQY